MRCHRLSATVFGSIGFLCVIAAGSAPPAARDPNDCGPIALHILMHFEGRPTPIDRIERHLPPPRPGGYSMKELRDASRALGFRLEGSDLGKEGGAIDRPMLAFLKVEKKGHFLVIRPIGHSGKLVQVIDSDQPPRVMDRADLVASDQWTGLVLAPARPGRMVIALSGLLGFTAIGLVAVVGRHLYRARRSMIRIIQRPDLFSTPPTPL